MTTLSVLLSTYNSPPRLIRSVASVRAQTTTGIELIICDNGSPGQPARNMLDQYEKEGIVIIRGPIEEPKRRAEYCVMADVINKGLDISTGKYIRYLTDNDEYTQSSCERMVAYLEMNPKVDLVWGMVEYFKNGIVEAPPPFFFMEHDKVAEQIRRCNFINQNSAMHKRTDIRWDTSAEAWKKADWLFWLRLLDIGFRFANIPEIVERFHFDGRLGLALFSGKTLEQGLSERL